MTKGNLLVKLVLVANVLLLLVQSSYIMLIIRLVRRSFIPFMYRRF